MKRMKSMLLAACVLVAPAAPALSQEPSAPESGLQRGYVTAVGGAAFSVENTPTFGVEYGDTLHRNVQAYATFSYFDNLMNETARNRLNQLGQLLTIATVTPWDFHGRDRAFAFSAGAKFLVPASATFRPYVGAGAGLMNLARTLSEHTRGEITQSLIDGFTVADGMFDAGAINATFPLGEASVGAVILAGRTYVDIGYRYRTTFHASNPLRFGQFGVGVGVKF